VFRPCRRALATRRWLLLLLLPTATTSLSNPHAAENAFAGMAALLRIRGYGARSEEADGIVLSTGGGGAAAAAVCGGDDDDDVGSSAGTMM